MNSTLAAGTHPFELDVPYELIETGDKGSKPLIVYLHGYKQNLRYFKKKCADMLSLNALHLFLQGPYPIYDEQQNRAADEWGRAWYLYDGRQEQFIRSMEKSSVFIERVIDEISKDRAINRRIILGYSMGGYLAGYFALSRPAVIDELVTIGARIKAEHFVKNQYPNLNVLAVHGKNDKTVAADRQKKSCEQLREMGAKVSYRTIEAGHRLSVVYILEIKEWLSQAKSLGRN